MTGKNQNNFDQLEELSSQISSLLKGNSITELKVNLENTVSDFEQLRSSYIVLWNKHWELSTKTALLEREVNELKNAQTQTKNASLATASVEQAGRWQVTVALIGGIIAFITAITTLIIQLVIK